MFTKVRLTWQVEQLYLSVLLHAYKSKSLSLFYEMFCRLSARYKTSDTLPQRHPAQICANTDNRALLASLARKGLKHKRQTANSNKCIQPLTAEVIWYLWKHRPKMMALVNTRWTRYSWFHICWQLLSHAGINSSPRLPITILSTGHTNRCNCRLKIVYENFCILCIIAAGPGILYNVPCIAVKNI